MMRRRYPRQRRVSGDGWRDSLLTGTVSWTFMGLFGVLLVGYIGYLIATAWLRNPVSSLATGALLSPGTSIPTPGTSTTSGSESPLTTIGVRSGFVIAAADTAAPTETTSGAYFPQSRTRPKGAKVLPVPTQVGLYISIPPFASPPPTTTTSDTTTPPGVTTTNPPGGTGPPPVTVAPDTTTTAVPDTTTTAAPATTTTAVPDTTTTTAVPDTTTTAAVPDTTTTVA